MYIFKLYYIAFFHFTIKTLSRFLQIFLVSNKNGGIVEVRDKFKVLYI